MLERLKKLFGFNLVTFTTLFMVFFIVSAITTSVMTNNNYNTSGDTEWILVGGLTSSSATFRIRTHKTSIRSSGVLLVSTNEDLSDPVFQQDVASGTSTSSLVQTLDATGLDVETLYYYGISTGDFVTRRGSFSTPALEGDRFNFRIATAGCAWTGSKSKVFSKIAQRDPLLFVHLGDFHYEDISENNTQIRIEAVDKVMGSSNQAQLFSSTGLVYMWDDHDWLGNDSTGEGEGRQSALETYAIGFPYYSPLPSTDNAQEGEYTSPYHAFTIGSVRFIVMDLRSEASLNGIYSDEQKAWLFDELSTADSYDFVVLVSTKPWIGEEVPPGEDDAWNAHGEDRAELSDYISTTIGAEDGPQNLLMISADAHMIAFDDGTNTYYGPDGNATLSFPILHNGPLDRLGSAKGGPFTHECHATRLERNHQYSVIDFEMPTSADGEPCMKIVSYDESDSEIISLELCGKIFSSTENAGEGSCDYKTFSSGSYALLGISAACLAVMSIVGGWYLHWRKGLSIFGLAFILGFGTLAVGVGIPLARGYGQFETFTILLIVMIQMICGLVFVGAWIVMMRKHAKAEETQKEESEENPEDASEANHKEKYELNPGDASEADNPDVDKQSL